MTASETLERRLHGVAIYNPDLLSKHELVAQFVARQELLDRIVEDLHRPGFNQHQIIVGSRGMGKTTMLRRLRYAIEDDEALAAVWLPLTFPEEQYNVGRLSDLYLNFIDALGDALEQGGRREEAGLLDDAVEALPKHDEPKRAAAALDLLLTTADRLQRRLVLLIDNLDLVLERLEKQNSAQWSFRELLSHEHRLLLIGAMPVVIGATYEYGKPFYDFFRVHELRGLSRDETRLVLTRLSRELEVPSVERLLERDPGRVDTLHTLTGGNPRTIVLLFGVLAQGTDGDVRSDLEKLLDQCTPLYKARFEALPPQAQQVVDAVAIHWDPISAGELTEKLPMEVNAISAQLNRLVQQGVLEKVEYHPATKIGFQVAERFFNIWYLMRASRRVRRRLIWLVQFLRLFYGADQVKTKARDLLDDALRTSSDEKLRHVEFCLAIAQLIEDDHSMRYALESHAIRTLVTDPLLTEQIATMLDLDGEDRALRSVVDRERWLEEFNRAIDQTGFENDEKERARDLIGGAPVSRDRRLVLAKEIADRDPSGRAELYKGLQSTRTEMQQVFGERFSGWLVEALRAGYMNDIHDRDGAGLAAEILHVPDLEVYATADAISVERLALLSPTGSSYVTGAFVVALLDAHGAEVALHHLPELDRKEPSALADIAAGLVLIRSGQAADAAKRFERAAQRPGLRPVAMRQLARARLALDDREGALRAFEEALVGERDADTLFQYGRLLATLERHAEAETALRDALQRNPDHASAATALARLLLRTHRFDDAFQITQAFGSSSDPRLRFAHFRALLSRGDEAAALQNLRLLAAEATEPSVIVQYARLMFILQAGDDGLATLRRAAGAGAERVIEIAAQMLETIGEAVRHGYVAPLLQMIEEFELQDPLRPAYEALRIIVSGERGELKRLAPEVQQVTADLLARWAPSQKNNLKAVNPKARKKTVRRRLR